MSTRKTTAEKIEAAKLEKQQMEERIKKLLQEQKAEERKKRNHRISHRGAHLESILPDTIGLSDKRFYSFLEKTVANDFGRRTLAALVAEQKKEDAANGVDITADNGDSPAETANVAAAQGDNAPEIKSATPPQNTVKTAELAAQATQNNGAAAATKTTEADWQGA